MSLDLTEEIILREAQFVKDSDQFDELEIDFMGGKPFMNFPLICFATTNATLLTEEIKTWLREHKDSITLGASCDGTGKMQSTNRGTEKHNLGVSTFAYDNFQRNPADTGGRRSGYTSSRLQR